MALNRSLGTAVMHLAYFSGAARLLAKRRGGIGVILRFDRVRVSRQDGFQPQDRNTITPDRLDRVCAALRRWKLDVVSLAEAAERFNDPSPRPRRFAVVTFDGGYRDVFTAAAPILARHRIPYTVFVPTGFVDGIAPMWWLALEQVIRRHDRISLVIDRAERHFEIGELQQKYELYDYLFAWMRTLSSQQLSSVAADLSRLYSADLAGLSREAALTWDDLRVLARDPLLTIGSATVSYPALRALTAADALREMRMGRQVAEAALDRSVPHFAYPFGDGRAVARREIQLAQEAGLASAATSRRDVVRLSGSDVPFALPRVTWDGGWRSPRPLRVLAAGLFGETRAV